MSLRGREWADEKGCWEEYLGLVRTVLIYSLHFLATGAIHITSKIF